MAVSVSHTPKGSIPLWNKYLILYNFKLKIYQEDYKTFLRFWRGRERGRRGVCHADHKLLQLRCSSCAKPCFRAGGSHTNTTSQTGDDAVGTPARTYCPQHLINHCFISKGPLRSAVVQLHFGCTSASSESGEWNTRLSRSPELLSEPVSARSASPAGSGAAGERCPGRLCTQSLPTRGRQG